MKSLPINLFQDGYWCRLWSRWSRISWIDSMWSWSWTGWFRGIVVVILGASHAQKQKYSYLKTGITIYIKKQWPNSSGAFLEYYCLNRVGIEEQDAEKKLMEVEEKVCKEEPNYHWKVKIIEARNQKIWKAWEMKTMRYRKDKIKKGQNILTLCQEEKEGSGFERKQFLLL